MGLVCSFCGAKESMKLPIYQGATANICRSCLTSISEIDADTDTIEYKNEGILKPHEIKAELDKHVVGQEIAKKVLAVEAYNHYKRINSKSRTQIEKTNVMLLGPSGSGKTYLVQVLARTLNVPFYIADATGITETGYVGKDVDSMLVSLIEKCGGDISLAEKGIIYLDEADKLISKAPDVGRKRDVGGEGVQQALLKMIEGAEMTVEIPDPILRKKSVTINTKNILFIFGGAFDGIDKIVEKRMNPSKQSTMGFRLNKEETVVEVPIFQKKDKIEPQDIIEYGFINEFVGRVPLVATLHKLSEDDLIDVLTKVHNSIVKQYQALLRMDNVKLKFEKEALKYVAQEAIKRKVGARGLRGILADKMNELQYEIPMKGISEFTVTKEYLEAQ